MVFAWIKTKVTLDFVHEYGSRCAHPDDFCLTIKGDLESFSKQVGQLLVRTGELSNILVGFPVESEAPEDANFGGVAPDMFRLTKLPAFQVGNHTQGYPHAMRSVDEAKRKAIIGVAAVPQILKTGQHKKRMYWADRKNVRQQHAGKTLWLAIDPTGGALSLNVEPPVSAD